MKIITIITAFTLSINLAQAQDCDIIIKNNNFTSGKLKRSSGQDCEFEIKSEKKHRLKICNHDNKVIEFESHELLSEKIIAGKKYGIVKIRKLKKGKIYHFFEEFSGTKCQFKAI